MKIQKDVNNFKQSAKTKAVAYENRLYKQCLSADISQSRMKKTFPGREQSSLKLNFIPKGLRILILVKIPLKQSLVRSHKNASASHITLRLLLNFIFFKGVNIYNSSQNPIKFDF